MDTYHRWMEVVIGPTLAGLPAISVPIGFGAAGLPMGLQIIGPAQADLAVLQLAHAHEGLTRWVSRRPPAMLEAPGASTRPRSNAGVFADSSYMTWACILLCHNGLSTVEVSSCRKKRREPCVRWSGRWRSSICWASTRRWGSRNCIT
ncbi:amidase family protein [Pseudomonas aeruginosa]